MSNDGIEKALEYLDDIEDAAFGFIGGAPEDVENLAAKSAGRLRRLLADLQSKRPQSDVKEAVKIAIECLGKHGDGFVDLGAMTVLQDWLEDSEVVDYEPRQSN